jgi:hypothetical protein
LKWYIKINQRAPIQPPTRQSVNQLFDLLKKDDHGTTSDDKDKNNNNNIQIRADGDSITIDEFGNFCRGLWRRALVRVLVHQLVTFVGAPLLANYVVAKSSQHAHFVTTLQTLCQTLLPARIYPKVATKTFARMALIVLFCVTLGNFVMSRVNEVQSWWLRYQENRKKHAREKVKSLHGNDAHN